MWNQSLFKHLALVHSSKWFPYMLSLLKVTKPFGWLSNHQLARLHILPSPWSGSSLLQRLPWSSLHHPSSAQTSGKRRRCHARNVTIMNACEWNSGSNFPKSWHVWSQQKMPLKDLRSSMWTSSSFTLTQPNKWQYKYKDVNTTLGDMSLGHMFIVCMRMLIKTHFNRIDINKLMSSTPMQVRSVCLCFHLWFFGPCGIT